VTAYGEWLESRSRELIATGLAGDERLRELLILSVGGTRRSRRELRSEPRERRLREAPAFGIAEAELGQTLVQEI
jgi:hypothetical protein